MERADHCEWIDFEHRFVRAQSPFQAGGGSGANHLGVNAEFLREFPLPLLAQVRRADNGEPFDISAVEQFPGNQGRLDGLADTHIVGDEQTDGVELQRHEQGHELVGARFDVEIAEAPEGPGAGAELQTKRVAEQERRVVGPWRVGVREFECSGLRRLGLKRQIDERRIVFGSAKRAELEKIVAGFGQDNPLAAARSYKVPGLESGRG